jgi:cytochrome c biogenesis protein CcdA
LAAQERDLGRVALCAIFGVGAATPLVLIGLMSLRPS